MENGGMRSDFDMAKRLRFYVDKGRVTDASEEIVEPMAWVRPEPSLIKKIDKLTDFSGSFFAVDCSTRTLKRANNWGVYLIRASYAQVKGHDIDWGYQERLCTAVGDADGRSNFLKDVRIELESQMALSLLDKRADSIYYDHTNGRSNYLLLDGGGYFGGDRKFRVSLYERCEKEGLNLPAISKNSPSLHDEKGRDLLAAMHTLTTYPFWVYHPVRKADKDKSLYGDIAIVKLCEDSRYVFRCDIMEYLTGREIEGVISPLTCISGDPRCVGYPVTLWLAHEFSASSDSMLLSYHDQIEQTLKDAGLLDILRREELSCSFADELHGVKRAFDREWWDGQF
jgi:hypothetical protein